MRTVMYTHGGSKNHGCEAIIRTTSEILRRIDRRPVLLSYSPEEDSHYGVDRLVEVRPELGEINKKSVSFLSAYASQKLTGNYHKMDALMHKKAIVDLPEMDLALFVGGDNYCYSDVKNYCLINNYMRMKAKKLILWGTSVEPELLKDEEIRKDIQKFDHIVARESISYEALKKVKPNTILLPDSAFHLKSEKVTLPQGFEEKNTIGINISPLVMEHEKESGKLLKSYERLLEYIIQNTEYKIALIPHVVWESNDDRKPLRHLYEKYKDSGKVLLIEDHNCLQQKYIISKCKMFLGARTHATIAAYSTCVPTIVVGYSVKARGIARDLFGTEENYVVSAQSLDKDDELVEAFLWLCENEEEIVQILRNKMDKYKQYKDYYLKDIIDERKE